MAAYAMAAKGLDGVDERMRPQITETVRTALARLEAKGIVSKIVE